MITASALRSAITTMSISAASRRSAGRTLALAEVYVGIVDAVA